MPAYRVTIPYSESAHPSRIFTIGIDVVAIDPEEAKKAALDIFQSHENNVFASWVRDPLLEKISVEAV